MLDNIKEYVDKQREDFEVYSFDHDKGWNEISGKVSGSPEWPKWKVMSVVACILFVFFGTIYQLFPAGEMSELSEIESYYQQEIDQKIQLVKSQLNDPAILDDLNQMDQAFAELKGDLNENVDNEEVILAMMENYRLKLQILEEILIQLEKENSEKVL